MNGMESVLNQETRKRVEIIDSLALDSLRTRYLFVKEDVHKDLLSRDLRNGMRLYWVEQLQSAHFTAVTASLRSRHWLSAIFSAAAGKNLLAFAAALRGLIESAADADRALLPVPTTLAKNHQRISESLAGNATTTFISHELQEAFIHFSHARYLRSSERASTPATHEARPTSEYLQIFGNRNEHGIGECYRFACDLLHPAAPSVYMWLSPGDGKESSFSLLPHQDESIIRSFSQEHETAFEYLLMFAFTPSILVLNVLNYFPITDLHTPRLSKWNFDDNQAWKKCEEELKRNGATPLV